MKARKRITAKDSTLDKRAAAMAVWAAMKARTKFGIVMKIKKNYRRRPQRKRQQKNVYYQ